MTDQEGATLSDVPTGHELEEFFAAVLQSAGAYVEKNIEDPNVLELDIVATEYATKQPASTLIEVKGTEPRLGDIFKLIGRMTYLGIAKGAFITTVKPRDAEAPLFEKVCAAQGVAFVACDDLKEATDRLAVVG